MNKNQLAILAAFGVVMAPVAEAEIRFNGFASIYAGMTLDDDESLYDYDDDISFKPESLFGLQATADLTEGLTATAQLLARGSDDFDAKFEWAYLTYTLNDNFDVSAGRLRIPFFKYSEYLDVGYAFPWARTPRDVYDIDFNTMEGARLNYTNSFGYWDVAVQGVYGNLDTNLFIAGADRASKLDGISGISVDMTRDWFSFRLGYTIADVSVDAGLAALAPLFVNPSDFDDVQILDDSGYFGSAGVFVDYQDWLVNAEIVQYEAEDSILPTNDAFYIMLGKRFDDITVAYTYSGFETENKYGAVSSIPGFIPNPAPGTEPVCGATAQDYVRNCVITQESKYNTHSMAVRWNFHASASFTLDLTKRDADIVSGRPSSDSDTLLSAGVDLVF